jgi:polyhydroxyalkanoate synthesis regulator phasin
MKNASLSFELKSLYRLAISFLAVVFLVFNTACGSSEIAATNDLPTGSHPSGQTPNLPNLYDPLTPPQGGMNNYKDTDPRTDASDAEAKADRLINRANSQQKGGKNPLKEVRKELNKKGPQDRAEDLSEDLGRSAKKKTEQVSQGAKRGIENVKENAKSFADDVSSGADDLSRNAQGKVEDLKQATKKTADAITKG